MECWNQLKCFTTWTVSDSIGSLVFNKNTVQNLTRQLDLSVSKKFYILEKILGKVPPWSQVSLVVKLLYCVNSFYLSFLHTLLIQFCVFLFSIKLFWFRFKTTTESIIGSVVEFQFQHKITHAPSSLSELVKSIPTGGYMNMNLLAYINKHQTV